MHRRLNLPAFFLLVLAVATQATVRPAMAQWITAGTPLFDQSDPGAVHFANGSALMTLGIKSNEVYATSVGSDGLVQPNGLYTFPTASPAQITSVRLVPKSGLSAITDGAGGAFGAWVDERTPRGIHRHHSPAHSAER